MREKRRFILRFLLGSLAVAAVAGVAAVLFAEEDFLLRVMFTCLVAAGGAALVLPLSLLLERERTAPAGLLAIAIVIAEFILALGVIWMGTLTGRSWEEELGMSMWMVLVTGLPACLFLALAGTRSGFIAGFSGLATSAGALVAFALAIWLPGRWYQHDDIWGTGWTIGGLGIPIAICLIGGITPARPWRWVGVVAGVVATLMILNEIWDWALVREEWLLVPIGLALLPAYANALFLAKLRPGQSWLRIANVAVASGLTLMVDIIVWDPPALDLLGRMTAALAILTGCGTLAFVVIVAINRRTDIAEDVLAVRLTGRCPRCRAQLELPVGKSVCTGCGLRFALKMEDPRCAECGYLLFGNQSDQCPECGTAIRGATRAPARSGPP